MYIWQQHFDLHKTAALLAEMAFYSQSSSFRLSKFHFKTINQDFNDLISQFFFISLKLRTKFAVFVNKGQVYIVYMYIV